MTKEQFNEIETKLAKWREERRISVEDKKLSFRVDYAEKLLRYFKSELDENKSEMIDALCDLIVIAINAGIGFEYATYESYAKRIKDAVLRGAEKEKLEEVAAHLRMYLALPLSEPEAKIDYLALNLVVRGYDPYKCLLETIKELESRTGSWNEEKGKWIKDEGAYTFEEAIEKSGFKYVNKVCEGVMDWYVLGGESEEVELEQKSFKKWHKADYSKCKLGD